MVLNKKRAALISVSLIIAYYFFRIIGQDIAVLEAFLIATGLLVFLWSGFYLAWSTSVCFKKNLSLIEIVCFSFLADFLLFPILLTILFFSTKNLNENYPILILILVNLISFFILQFNKDTKVAIDIPDIKKSIKSYIFWIFFAAVLFIAINTTLYSHLPDLDPYGWLLKMKENFSKLTLGAINKRILFTSISFLLHNLLSLDLFYIFKYIYPFFTLSILFPLLLIAGRYKNLVFPAIIMLTFFASPVVLAAYLVPMPQIFWIILFYFFIVFLIHSSDNSENGHLFFIAGGMISLFGIFYHIAFSIFFIVWFMIAILKYGKNLLCRDKKTLFLIAIIIISNLKLLKIPYVFISRFTEKALSGALIKFKMNLCFPYRYTNIDGNQMGWENLGGVIKYYAYYAGPAVLFIIISFIVFLMLSKKFKKYFYKVVLIHGYAVVFSIFIFMFFLAEVFPRFGGMAMLPDRVWIFAGISTLVLTVWILDFININFNAERVFQNSIYKKYIVIYFFAIIISVIGAFYVNNSKRYLMTKEQIDSTEWIKENIPENSFFYSVGMRNLLAYHARSNIKFVDSKFFYDPDYFKSITDKKEKSKVICTDSDYKKLISNIDVLICDMERTKKKIIENNNLQVRDMAREELRKIFLSNKNDITNPCLNKNVTKSNAPSEYVYYALPHSNNPYLHRPYLPSAWGFKMKKDKKFILDNYPEKISRIYEKDGVIIWKMK